MNVLQTLIFFSVLPALLDAQTFYTVLEGEDTKITCPPSEANERKFFCREDCKQNDILVETLGVSAQSDRYSIEWERRGQSSVGDVSIKISQLKKSDSGQYTCGVGPLTSATYDYNEIVVVDAKLGGGERETPTISAKSGGDVRISCPFSSSFHQLRISAFLCRVETLQCLFVPTKVTGNTLQYDRYTIRYVQYTSGSGFVYVSISQLKKSDSGQYRCGLRREGLLDIWSVFDVDVSDEPTVETQTSASENYKPGTTPSKPAAPPKTTLRSTTDTLLYVGLTLVVLLGLFLLVLLIFYKRKSSKPKERQENLQQAPEETSKRPKDPPVEPEYASITEINKAKYTKPKRMEVSSDYSLVFGPETQHTAEDDSSKLTYSELDFSNRTASSLNSAPGGHPDNVIYSTPR